MDEGIEFWFARDLMEPLGYVRWENFQTAIKRAIESFETTGYEANDHFRGVTKMIEVGKGGQRVVDDFVDQEDLRGEHAITREHVQNNESVRDMLDKRGIKPELLPPEEDIKKLERRIKTDERKLVEQSGKLPSSKLEE
jgi:hypothetical protein